MANGRHPLHRAASRVPGQATRWRRACRTHPWTNLAPATLRLNGSLALGVALRCCRLVFGSRPAIKAALLERLGATPTALLQL